VLTQLTEQELPTIIASLNPDALDILMKYIYKFMARQCNFSLMLKLHAQVLDKAGQGSIVRVLADRKTV
jgi:hypothetical protein